MKTTVTYYLLILYTLAVCKPVLPIVKDEIAHFFWQAEHMATVHTHHGDHHAAEETAIAAHEEDNSTPPASSKPSEPVSIHLIKESIYAIPPLLCEQQKFCTNTYRVSSFTVEKHYPPPKPC